MNAQETNRTRGFPKAPKLESITASESEAAGSALGFPKKRHLRHCLLDQTLVDEEKGPAPLLVDSVLLQIWTFFNVELCNE
jgi:hypothetical protein